VFVQRLARQMFARDRIGSSTVSHSQSRVCSRLQDLLSRTWCSNGKGQRSSAKCQKSRGTVVGNFEVLLGTFKAFSELT
jgi:hypothetical protein